MTMITIWAILFGRLIVLGSRITIFLSLFYGRSSEYPSFRQLSHVIPFPVPPPLSSFLLCVYFTSLIHISTLTQPVHTPLVSIPSCISLYTKFIVKHARERPQSDLISFTFTLHLTPTCSLISLPHEQHWPRGRSWQNYGTSP